MLARVGWVAPGKYKNTIEWLKFTTSAATATLPQMAIAQFSKSNVALLSQDVTHTFLAGTRVTHPSGGFVLWVQLPKRWIRWNFNRWPCEMILRSHPVTFFADQSVFQLHPSERRSLELSHRARPETAGGHGYRAGRERAGKILKEKDTCVLRRIVEIFIFILTIWKGILK
jgi:DNA-binding transcriptional MocR family regulator